MRRREFLKAAALTMAAPHLARAKDSKTLRFVPQADLSILDPIATPAFVTRHHGYMVYDTLYGVDSNFVARPQMVEGHIVENDGKLWRLTLRPGLKFHDGESVLAKDVVASLKRWGKRDTFGLDLFARTDELTARSDSVVEFRLRRPFPLLPDVLGKAGTNMPCIMPERLANADPFKPLQEVVGSGPFEFVANERMVGSRAVYKKFAGYTPRPAGEPDFLSGPKRVYIDRVEWLTQPDPATAAAALQTGEVDWWEEPGFDLLSTFRRRSSERISVQDKNGYYGVFRMNHLQPPFNNPAVRRALFPGIDQAEFMRAVVGDDQELSRTGIGYISPGPMASDIGMERLNAPRDVAMARRMLKDAGYKGEKVVLISRGDFSATNTLCLIMDDYLRKIGMNVDLQITDFGTILQRFNNSGPVESGGWSGLCTYTTGAVTINPADHRLIRSMGLKGGIYGWPEDPQIEQLRSDYLDSPDSEAQKEACRKLQGRAFDFVPYIPLGIFYQPTIYSKKVDGIQSGFPLFYGLRKN